MKKKIAMLLMTSLIVASIGTGCGAPAASGSDSKAEATTESSTDDSAKEDEAESETSYKDIIKDVAYEDDDDATHKLDLYGTETKKEATPTVIEVHGGGFVGGTKDINIDHSVFFAEAGYKVVTPEYGKIPTDGSFKDTVQDLFAMYNWVADNADKYQFDLNNIFLSGDSAGGYYVLLTCAIWHSQSLQEYFGVTLPAYNFSSYLTTCPDADIRQMQEDIKLDGGPKAHIAQTIGEDIVMDEDLMSHLDLFSNVEPQAFENLYMLTTPGDTTTGETVQKFEQYLNDNGVAHTFKSYENQENELGHVFNITKPDYVESIQANQDMVDYMNSLISK